MEPVTEVQISVIQRQQNIRNQAWHHVHGPALYLLGRDANDLLGFPLTIGCPEEPEDGRAERAAHEALCGGGVVQEADLQGQLSIRPQVDPLDQFVGGPIHHIQMVSVEAVGDMLWVESAPEGLGGAPLCADQDVVVRLVPVVVAELQGFDLPVTLHDE
mmetsp:Transcript_24559/g.39954  ORF Transcript_24559/g.39954 Transcript_24559/m.39954 type:complete len:159 (-) Transcript_24559:665-1141(-)